MNTFRIVYVNTDTASQAVACVAGKTVLSFFDNRSSSVEVAKAAKAVFTNMAKAMGKDVESMVIQLEKADEPTLQAWIDGQELEFPPSIYGAQLVQAIDPDDGSLYGEVFQIDTCSSSEEQGNHLEICRVSSLDEEHPDFRNGVGAAALVALDTETFEPVPALQLSGPDCRVLGNLVATEEGKLELLITNKQISVQFEAYEDENLAPCRRLVFSFN